MTLPPPAAHAVPLPPVRPAVRLALLGGLAALSAVTAGWVVLCLYHGWGLIHESGVLTGLAWDAARGTLYRPLMGPGGYGGTRYGPVAIGLQAGLIRVGIDPLFAGEIVVLASAAVLACAMLGVLRREGLTAAAAGATLALMFVSPTTAHALIEIRPDVLPAALNVAGLVMVMNAARGRRSAGLVAGALFGVAVAAKMSAGFGVVAAVVFLSGRRQFRAAVVTAVVAGAVAVAVMAAADWVSGGRMLDNFRACANPGGRHAHGAGGLLGDWVKLLNEVWIKDDWPGTALTAVAALAWAVSPRAVKWSLPGCYLLVTVPLTVAMYVSPGLSTNHLIDAHVAAVLFLGTYVARGVWWRSGLAAAVTGLVAVSLLMAVQKRVLSMALFPRTQAFRKAVAAAVGPGGNGPILSDHAGIPVAVGQIPFLLDDFMFPAVKAVRPDAQADLYRRLDEHYFAAIVLRYDPAGAERRWVFGDEFAAKSRPITI